MHREQAVSRVAPAQFGSLTGLARQDTVRPRGSTLLRTRSASPPLSRSLEPLEAAGSLVS